MARPAKRSTEMAAATIRTILAQATAAQLRTRLNVAADLLGRQFRRSDGAAGRCRTEAS
ncbi:hypothetical protein [Streptomyces olivaceiscleroticus]|uniref:hypothetical protein n=1 Tax=Streptomyces olivaceiscleroticus TaxID=68245 RepID=UPI0031F7E6A8